MIRGPTKTRFIIYCYQSRTVGDSLKEHNPQPPFVYLLFIFSILQMLMQHPSGAPDFTPGFQRSSCYLIFSSMCMFYRSLFVLLSFFSLCCLSFFDLPILITPLVSSNSSYIFCMFIIRETSVYMILQRTCISCKTCVQSYSIYLICLN